MEHVMCRGARYILSDEGLAVFFLGDAIPLPTVAGLPATTVPLWI